MLVTIDHIAKAFGDQTVLSNVSLQVHRGQKLGLVGANGAGKTTLLRMITGELTPDQGKVQLDKSMDLGYLAQTLDAASARLTVQGLIDAALRELRALENRLRRLEAAMAASRPTPDPNMDSLLAEYGSATERYEQRGGYEMDHRQEWVLAGLDVAHIAPTRPLATLSGGEKSRVGLAALLLRHPDLLVLDEPTNHLDFAALNWLEEYLEGFPGGILVVSHDRDFLNRTVHALVEIQEYDRTSRHYAGNYDFYTTAKAQEMTRWIADYTAQQEEIWALRKAVKSKARQVAHNRPPRDGDKFIPNFKDGRVQSVIARNVRSAEEKLRRIEENPIPRPPRALRFHTDFDPAELANQTPLIGSQIAHGYAGNTLFTDVDLAVHADSRIVIVGPNGSGKSTLLRILAGDLTPDHGEIHQAASLRMGYLDQEQATLDPDLTVMEAFRAGRVGDPEAFKAELLVMGLFIYPELEKRVGTLSVGQKRKLQIAQLVTSQANLLLLDEPTNHISLDVLEGFEEALLNFTGPVVAVSHDRRFIRRFAREIWALEQQQPGESGNQSTGNAQVRRYLGGWDEYYSKSLQRVSASTSRSISD